MINCQKLRHKTAAQLGFILVTSCKSCRTHPSTKERERGYSLL